MKGTFIAILCCICWNFGLAKEKVESTLGSATGNTSDEEENGALNALTALLSYNFSGNKKGLTNLTPVINYGWLKEWKACNDRPNWKWALEVQPYVGGQINMRDSSSYLPGLMLPGIAGLKVDFALRYQKEKGLSIMLAPANFGYKLVSNFADTNITLAQHNIRSIIAIGYADWVMLSVQHTYGWHNSISESESGYNTVFGNAATDVQYLNISLQTKLTNLATVAPTYLFVEWRGILNSSAYSSFQNKRIISFGIRSDFGFKNVSSAKKYSGSFNKTF